MSVDFSIFENAHNDFMYSHHGPFKYKEFNRKSRRIIDMIVGNINKKYNKQYDSKKAFGIEDDSSPRYIWIGLRGILGREDYYVTFTDRNYDVLDADTFDRGFYYMDDSDVSQLKHNLGLDDGDARDVAEFEIALIKAKKIPPLGKYISDSSDHPLLTFSE